MDVAHNAEDAVKVARQPTNVHPNLTKTESMQDFCLRSCRIKLYFKSPTALILPTVRISWSLHSGTRQKCILACWQTSSHSILLLDTFFLNVFFFLIASRTAGFIQETLSFPGFVLWTCLLAASDGYLRSMSFSEFSIDFV